jgi:hypothetical protein
MADSLYVSLWFPGFAESEIMPRMVSVLRQFPFSQQKPGISYLALHPVSWSEPTILERKFSPGLPPEDAAEIASDLLHDDYAYLFDAYWDLWSLNYDHQQWSLWPSQVRFIAQGEDFDEGTSQETGHIQVDFGLDTPFLHEEGLLTGEAEEHVRVNVHKLVDFTIKAEKNTGASGRLLWSESRENLAQKLIARLQKIQ